MKGLFGSFSYYKLRAREHFIHNLFSLGSKGYRVGSVGWKTMGNKSKLMTRAGLRNSQCRGNAMTNTMKGNFSDEVWDIV